MRTRSTNLHRPAVIVALCALGLLGAACTTPPNPTPNAVPDQIDAVTATASVRSATLDFTDPAPGSSFIIAFEVSVNGEPEQPLPTDRILTGLTEGTSYSFRVRACNAWGCAAWSPDSNAVVPDAPVAVPEAIASVTAVPGNQSATLTYATPADGGSPITTTEVLVNGGTPSSLAANGVVTGLVNGTSYSFRLRACNAVGCGELSPPSNSVTPRTVPAAPSVSASVSSRTINWSWNSPANNGSPVTSFTVRLDGAVVQTGTARTFSRTFGYSQTHTLSVTATNAAGTGPAGTRSATTVAAPAPKITLSRGGAGPIGGSYWYSVTLANFTPGTSVTLTCRDSVDPGGFYSQAFTINSAGSASDSTLCYSADGPDHWVTGGGVTSNHVTWN